MLSGGAARAISRVAISPSGAAWFKIERHVFKAQVGTNLSCQDGRNKPLPSSSRNALQRPKTAGSGHLLPDSMITEMC